MTETNHIDILGNAFILVFSISSRQSLEELKPVLELINEVAEEYFSEKV